MAQPQDGIFRDGSPFHYFLEYNLSADADGDAIRAALARALEPASPDSGVSLVAAFGEALWTRLSPGWAPPGFRVFEPIGSEPRRRAPATQRDLWVWIHGEHHDRNFDRALRIQRNDLENIPMFWIIGLLYVLMGASSLGAAVYCWTFTIARVAHTVVYWRGMQPARGLLWLLGLLCLVGMAFQVIWRAL